MHFGETFSIHMVQIENELMFLQSERKKKKKE